MFLSVSMAYNVPFTAPYVLEPYYVDMQQFHPDKPNLDTRSQHWLKTKNPINKFLVSKQIRIRPSFELWPSEIDKVYAEAYTTKWLLVIENKKVLKLGKSFFPKIFASPHIFFEDLVKLVTNGLDYKTWCKFNGYTPYKTGDLPVLDFQKNVQLFFGETANKVGLQQLLGVTTPKPPVNKTPEYVITVDSCTATF